jgi:hypothetical protein
VEIVLTVKEQASENFDDIGCNPKKSQWLRILPHLAAELHLHIVDGCGLSPQRPANRKNLREQCENKPIATPVYLYSAGGHEPGFSF